jgi:hypothetical protein
MNAHFPEQLAESSIATHVPYGFVLIEKADRAGLLKIRIGSFFGSCRARSSWTSFEIVSFGCCPCDD